MTDVASDDRGRSFRIPLTDDELRMLHALAEDEDVSGAALLRRFIRKSFAKKFGNLEAAATKKPGRRK